MADELNGKKVAFLVANEGVEQVELTRPWEAIEEAGGEPELIAPDDDGVQAFNHLDKGDTFEVTRAVADANPDGYDGLVLPGGVANPDVLRTVPKAVEFVRSFFEAGKPVAAICHAPWTLIEAGVVDGRTLTSWPSLQTDIRNAGGNWVDEEVHVDSGLVTSRKPDDLDAFCAKAVEEIGEGIHAEQREATTGGAHRAEGDPHWVPGLPPRPRGGPRRDWRLDERGARG
jgi:protease I